MAESPTGAGGAGRAGIPAESIRTQLARILASREFINSGRISRFLRFVVEQVIAERGPELKEYLLGIEVFDKKPSFDPRIDPIVRVEARRLRSKLAKYYEEKGADDPVWIKLHTGCYAPEFRLREAALAERPPGGAAGVAPRENIAVLPFANLSAEAENEYFSDGLTEELIHALTKVDGLHVVASPSAFQFKGARRDIRRIGEQLHVGTVLEGSVRRAGERLRVTAQLIDVAEGVYLWSETYEREMKDVFAIQDEISRAIVLKLRVELADGPAGRAAQPLVEQRTENLAAYNLYLRGRYCWNHRTEERLHKGIEYFEAAIAGDPDFAPAYVGLADSYALLGQYGMAAPREVMPKAKAAAEKALEIDGRLAEAHASLGLVRSLYDWDWADAERHYRLAIRLNPGCAAAHHWYAIDYLAVLGRIDEAYAEILRAQSLDPLSLIINTNLGDILLIRQQCEQAMEQYRRTLDLDPGFYRTHWDLGWAYEEQGRFAEAVAAFERARELSGGSPLVLGDLGYCYAQWGRRDRAEALLAELLELERRCYVAPVNIAIIYLGLGQSDDGFAWLGRACEERDCRLMWLKEYPMYGKLRADPRFRFLQRKMGLAR